MLKPRSGFTLVELLIVIVVIAILAAISVVVYDGIIDRANDARRKSDISVISKTIQINNLTNGQDSLRHGSGCGANGNGSGWWHSDETSYPKSVRECLVDAGYTQVSGMADPSGCEGGGATACPAPRFRYMVLACELNGVDVSYALARLATEPVDSTATDNLCTYIYGGANFTLDTIKQWDTAYGINYLVRIY